MTIGCGVFVQAEDGIRALVRSRGLGDVYKRQPPVNAFIADCRRLLLARRSGKTTFTRGQQEKCGGVHSCSGKFGCEAVSYTHLTLPTSDLV